MRWVLNPHDLTNRLNHLLASQKEPDHQYDKDEKTSSPNVLSSSELRSIDTLVRENPTFRQSPLPAPIPSSVVAHNKRKKSSTRSLFCLWNSPAKIAVIGGLALTATLILIFIHRQGVFRK